MYSPLVTLKIWDAAARETLTTHGTALRGARGAPCTLVNVYSNCKFSSLAVSLSVLLLALGLASSNYGNRYRSVYCQTGGVTMNISKFLGSSKSVVLVSLAAHVQGPTRSTAAEV